VSVMPGSCLVFNVTGVDGNLSRFFFRSTINIFVGHGFTPSLLGKDLGDGLRKSGFAVIDMANGTDVDVRFVTVEFVSCGGKRTAGDVKSWSVLRGQHTLGGLLSNGGSEAVHVGMEAVAQRRRIQKAMIVRTCWIWLGASEGERRDLRWRRTDPQKRRRVSR